MNYHIIKSDRKYISKDFISFYNYKINKEKYSNIYFIFESIESFQTIKHLFNTYVDDEFNSMIKKSKKTKSIFIDKNEAKMLTKNMLGKIDDNALVIASFCSPKTIANISENIVKKDLILVTESHISQNFEEYISKSKEINSQ